MAYERTKARPKIPAGSLEMSLRSSASRIATEILVAFAICRSETPRRSRAARSLPPKSPGARSTDMANSTNGDHRTQLIMLGSRFQTVNEETDRGDAGGAGGQHIGDPIRGDPADCEHRNRCGADDRAQTVETQELGRAWLRRRREDGTGDQVVGT